MKKNKSKMARSGHGVDKCPVDIGVIKTSLNELLFQESIGHYRIVN